MFGYFVYKKLKLFYLSFYPSESQCSWVNCLKTLYRLNIFNLYTVFYVTEKKYKNVCIFQNMYLALFQ